MRGHLCNMTRMSIPHRLPCMLYQSLRVHQSRSSTQYWCSVICFKMRDQNFWSCTLFILNRNQGSFFAHVHRGQNSYTSTTFGELSDTPEENHETCLIITHDNGIGLGPGSNLGPLGSQTTGSPLIILSSTSTLPLS